MDAKSLKTLAISALLILICKAGWGQSLSYSNAIANLNPAGYWPMHEVEPAAQGDIETNYGSLGLLGTGFYPDWEVNSGEFIRQQTGALVNDMDQAILFNPSAPGGGTITNAMIIPHTSRFSTLYPPFTVECWIKEGVTNSGVATGDIVGQCGGIPLNGSGERATVAESGFRLYDNTGGGSGIVVYFDANGTASTHGTSTLQTNLWYHVVVTCDANTNVAVWTNGVEATGFPVSFVGKYIPDYWTPLTVGNGYGFNRAYHGTVDEVAIYTNVITDIATHYNDGISGAAGQYYQDVINDNPVIYLRMDSSPYSAPPSGSWPALINYGQSNGVAIGNGVYTPGTMPGIVSGASYTNFPVGLASTNVAQLNGMSSFADAGSAQIYNPTGGMPFSVTALFRGNPADNRVQSIVGHGTNSWELGLTTNGLVVFNSGTNSTAVVATYAAAGDLDSTNVLNDGFWHLVVATHNNTTNVLYVDGVLNNTNIVGANSLGNSLDVMIGSDPSYTNTPVGWGRQFAGQICEVGFFTNALTLAQVQTLYNLSGILPKISQQPVSASVNSGVAFTNTVEVNIGSTPFYYQWYTNGVAIGGATNSSLIFNPVLGSNASTNYYVVVTNDFGAVTSAVASLTVYTIPAFTSQLPIPYTNLFALYAGVSPTFSVAATGPEVTYQWFTNGMAVDGATDTSFTLTNVQVSFTNDYCVAANSFGSTTSIVWSASVIAEPTNSTGLAPYPHAVLALNPIAYWRMNDTNLDGVDYPSSLGNGDFGWICHDYAGGNDGMYTNCTLGWPGYNPTLDPSDSSAQFGEAGDINSDFGDSLAFGIQGVNFGSPHGTSVAFTVEAWVSGYPQGSDAGIVTLGWGNGGEQFDLDCGSDTAPTTHGFRFLIRDALGATHGVSSTVEPSTVGQGPWYHLVGVVDEISNQTVTFYINGVSVGTATVTNGSGILSSSYLMGIGSRMSSQNTNYNDQFLGNINDVAIFNYALSSNQVMQLFSASGLGPTFSQEPVNTGADYGGGTVVLSAGVSDATSYQWFNDTTGTPVLVTGQTNATLVLSNLTASANYYVTAYNAYGSTNSTTVSVNVISGGPQVTSGTPQSPFYAVTGQTVTNSVTAYGTWPLAYQWQYSTNAVNWTNVSGYRFSGVQSNVLTISDSYSSDAGFYQVVVTNIDNVVTSSLAQLIVIGVPLTFNTNGENGAGLFWTANGFATFATNLLTLTYTNSGNTAGKASYFYQIPQYIGAFEASFTYEALYAGSQLMADGATFCLQDDPRGASALGTDGGDLAYGGTPTTWITNSVALELNIFPGNGVGGMGYSINTNGAIGPTTPPGSVVLTNIPVDVTIYYANGQMALTFSNEVSGATYATNVNVGNITQVLGSSTAYVGFTGSYGGDQSLQTITNFSFVSLATQTITPNGTNVVVSWPASIAGYTLEESSSLTSGNWVNVTNPVNIVNGQNQVTTPSGGTNMFYRLILLQ